MLDMKRIVGTRDIIFITLDTLRYDVAKQCIEQGRLPNLSKYINGWEKRHSPGSFTFASHEAFFAGFLPTPTDNHRHERLFALAFAGSETSGTRTAVFDSETIVTGLRELGYHTVCIGGVGFFNKQTALGRKMPSYFNESHWSPELGVTDPQSPRNQVDLAIARLNQIELDTRAFLFINVSAIHQPNHFYVENQSTDDVVSHGAALSFVDSQLARLFEFQERRHPALVIICSDHGTAYGEGWL